jgi:lysozyme
MCYESRMPLDIPDPLILDISHYQTSVDWQAISDDGIIAVCLKATEGTSYIDPTFRERYEGAKKFGLGVFSYHFLRPGSIAKQIDHYLSTVNPRPGERLVIDYEDDALTITDLEAAITAILDSQAGEACEITVYGANGCLGAKLGGKRNALAAQHTSLWVASYTTAGQPTMTNLSATWPAWSLWQFSDKCSCGGISPVDGNRFNGSVEAARAWVGPALGPPPEQQVAEVTIRVAVDAPPGIKVNVTVEE